MTWRRAGGWTTRRQGPTRRLLHTIEVSTRLQARGRALNDEQLLFVNRCAVRALSLWFGSDGLPTLEGRRLLAKKHEDATNFDAALILRQQIHDTYRRQYGKGSYEEIRAQLWVGIDRALRGQYGTATTLIDDCATQLAQIVGEDSTAVADIRSFFTSIDSSEFRSTILRREN
jgi:hypothetical protein